MTDMLTPSQAQFMQEHRERRARIAALAKPDTPILCLSASARSQRADVPPVVLLEPIPAIPWEERQIQLYQPWFEVIEEIDPEIPSRPQMAAVIRACGVFYGISLVDLKASRRTAPIVKARQVAMFLCKEFTLRSLPEIGRQFADRDHTTVLHAVRKIERLESENSDLAAELNTLRQQIRDAL